jgi:4a-hydroxytetrahydrobiopterin dehydratase
VAPPRRLSPAGVRTRLRALNGKAESPWRVVRGTLAKRFEYADFRGAFAFMRRVAKAAEAMGHHPDWSNSYAKVDVRLSTHSAGGLTALDFELAAAMERVRGRPRGKPPKTPA